MQKLSVETEYDKAVEAVAISCADCESRKEWHVCKATECDTCKIKAYQINCMNNFADVDKLRVYNRMQELVVSKPVPSTTQKATGKDKFILEVYDDIRDSAKIIWYVVSIIFIVIISLLIPANCITKGYSQSLKDYDYSRYALPGEVGYVGKYRKQILDTLDRTKLYVTDVNKDGLVNCIDYSCTFKILWDKMYEPSDCEIVHNKSYTMNHLFIRVRQYGGRSWECIEPQAATRDITKYFMEDFWSPEAYNPTYNIYGETEFWLKEVRQ